MKKITLLLLLSFAVILGGCSKDPLAEKFELNNDVYTYTDTENSPFEDSGLQITIQKGEEGQAAFVKTDLEGRETLDYYIFDYSNDTVEKYYYVSAMGTGFYYYYDLEAEELVKMERDNGSDATESSKEAGRWESAAENTASEIKILEEYFETEHSVSIKEAVKK